MTEPRQPIFNIPPALLALIGGLALSHLLRESAPRTLDLAILRELAFVPLRLALAFDRSAAQSAISNFDVDTNVSDIDMLLGLLGDGAAKPWTLATYGLLHADWSHLGLNSIWLLAFGAPVARRLGPARFYALCLAATIAGALAHFVVHPFSLQPIVGASAGVSGLLGACMRFAFQRGQTSRLSLAQVFTDRRLLGFLGVWLAVNVITGLAAEPLGLSSGPIAWEAHIGGLAAGLTLFGWFDPGAAKPLAPSPEAAQTAPP